MTKTKNVKPKKWAHVVAVGGVWYATCSDAGGLSEAWVKTCSGRAVQFPKFTPALSDRACVNGNRKMAAWLREECLIEAERARDEFSGELFRAWDATRMLDSQVQDLNDYLFDPKFGKVANGWYVITAPLSRGGSQ